MIANLGPGFAMARVPLAAAGFVPTSRYRFRDRLDGARYVRDGQELTDSGLFVRLAPHQSHVLEVLE